MERVIPTTLGRVRVEVTGDGPGMLLWPSLLMSASLWRGQAAHFAATRTVVAVDPPGHGGSEPLRAAFSFDECARVIEELLDALDLDRVDYVGNSWGAMIGATFAASRPDRVRSCVLMNGTASPAGLRQKAEYTLLVAVARRLGGFRGPLTRSAVDAFLGPTTKRTRPDVVEHVRSAVAAADVDSVRWAVRSVVPDRPDQRPLLGRISAPTTVVAGREDATFPVQETREVADGIPGARFVVVEDAAHLVALEVPDRINAILTEHLAAS